MPVCIVVAIARGCCCAKQQPHATNNTIALTQIQGHQTQTAQVVAGPGLPAYNAGYAPNASQGYAAGGVATATVVAYGAQAPPVVVSAVVAQPVQSSVVAASPVVVHALGAAQPAAPIVVSAMGGFPSPPSGPVVRPLALAPQAQSAVQPPVVVVQAVNC